MNPGIAVVAGAGPGLGRALAQRFIQGGMRVALLARDLGRLQALTASLGHEAHAIACDLADQNAVEAAFTRIDRELGVPQCVIFNAGTYRPGAVLEIAPQDFVECWKIGCYAGLLVGQQAARRMVERGGGTILFTGATASLRGAARFVNLASPKFALRALAQSMARELGPRGVHVAHVIIDGQISKPGPDGPNASNSPDAQLEPSAIAESYWQLHLQPRSAWTLELDLRPWVERF
jgi:NAD(P)-dependent dehydrogenase (short-subunit alcohol dehydrogenase family)